MRLLLFLAVPVVAGSLYAADPGLLSLAIPDSQFMAGVNVGQVMLSPLGQYGLAQTSQLRPFPACAFQFIALLCRRH